MPLTGSVDAANARIDLFVDWTDVAGVQTDGTLFRRVGSPDAPAEYVRGLYGSSLLGEQAYVSDHEAALDEAIWYTAVSSTTSAVMTAGPFTIPSSGYVWLKDPGRPWADLRLDLCESPSGADGPDACPENPVISDTFTRTVASGWGNADTGQAWTVSGGPVSDYSVSGGQGRHLMSAVGSSRRTTIPAPFADTDVRVDVAFTQTVSGTANAQGGVMVRSLDLNNLYHVRLEFQPDGQLRLSVLRILAGVQTTLGTMLLTMSYAPNQIFTLRTQVQGQTIRARAWPADGAETSEWAVIVSDASLPAAGVIGTRSLLATGSTNVGASFLYDNFQVSAISDVEDDIAWVGFRDKDRAADVGLFPVLDKERPADVYARRKDLTTAILFVSRSLGSLRSIYDLFTAGGPLLVQVPDVYGMYNHYGQKDRYYQPDTLTEAYISLDQRKPVRLWSAPVEAVELPVGLPQGTDTANWCAIEERYATFADMAGSGYTWGQVATGAASGTDLPGLYGSGPYGSGPYGG